MTEERSLEDLHAHYNFHTGAFPSKGHAAVVAERLRQEFAKHGLNDTRFVALEGKGSTFTIFFPRLREYWWPHNVTNGVLDGYLESVIKDLIKEVARPT